MMKKQAQRVQEVKQELVSETAGFKPSALPAALVSLAPRELEPWHDVRVGGAKEATGTAEGHTKAFAPARVTNLVIPYR